MMDDLFNIAFSFHHALFSMVIYAPVLLVLSVLKVDVGDFLERWEHKTPWFLILFFPIPVLALQVTHLWQVPWWAGLRLAAISAAFGYLLLWLPFMTWNLIKEKKIPQIRYPVKVIRFINKLTAITLLILILIVLASAIIRDIKPHNQPHGISDGQFMILQYGLDVGPDVYFIVLDSYTGSRALLERFEYDNSWFLEELRGLGFQAGECTSPAAYTGPSLGAIMNARESAPEQDWINWRLVQRSLLRTTLEERGYDTIAFATGYDWDEIHDAAYYLAPEMPPGPTEFELFALGSPSWNDRLGDLYRFRTTFLLDHLADAASMPGSQFVFAHVVQPHPPFVFTADGSPQADADLVDPDWNGDDTKTVMYSLKDYEAGYTAQVAYISQAILEPLREILAQPGDPLILLFGDHGAWYAWNPVQARSVLCATYGNLPLDPGEAVKEIIDD